MLRSDRKTAEKKFDFKLEAQTWGSKLKLLEERKVSLEEDSRSTFCSMLSGGWTRDGRNLLDDINC